MSSFNKTLLMGNLTRDPQLKYLANQTAVCEFGIAVNRKFTKDNEQREEVTFVDITAFGKQAETLNQYTSKGKPIFIEGRLKFDSWEDKQGGKRSKLTVVVENFQFVGGRSDSDDNVDQRPENVYPRTAESLRGGGSRPEQPFGDEQQFKDDDIPFAWSGRQGQPL